MRPISRKSKLPIILAVCLITSAGLLLPSAAHGILGEVVNGLFNGFLNLALRLLSGLFGLLVAAFIALVQFDFTSFWGVGESVDTAWRLLRDLANMLIIIGMLYIAFSTILKVGSAKWKNLAGGLLIMAVAVNFSKTIALIILDAGQMLMMTFVRAFQDIAVDNLTSGLMISKIYNQGSNFGWNLNLLTTWATQWLMIFMMIITVLVMLVIVILLIIRIVMIWFFVAVSPIAFAGYALPALKKHASQWWSFYVKLVFFGPMLAFFLWFSFLFMSKGMVPDTQFDAINQSVGMNYTDQQFFASQATSADNIIKFLLAVILLIVGTGMAIKAADFGGKVAGGVWGATAGGLGRVSARWGKRKMLDYATGELNVKDKLGKVPGLGRLVSKIPDFNIKERLAGQLAKGGKVGKWAAGYVGSLPAGKSLLKYLTKEGRAGWGKRGQELMRISTEIAAAQAERESNKFFTKGKIDIPFEEVAKYRHEMKTAQDLGNLDYMAQVEMAAKAASMGGADGQRYRKAFTRLLASGGYLDDIMGDERIVPTIEKIMKEKYGYTDGRWSDEVALREFLAGYLDGTLLSDPGAVTEKYEKNPQKFQSELRLINELAEQGIKTNHWWFGGLAQYDDGMYRMSRMGAAFSKDGYAVNKNRIEDAAGNPILDADGHEQYEEIKNRSGKRLKVWDPEKKDYLMKFNRKANEWVTPLDDGTMGRFSPEQMQQEFRIRWYNADQIPYILNEFGKVGARQQGMIAPPSAFPKRNRRDPLTGKVYHENSGPLSELQRGLNRMRPTSDAGFSQFRDIINWAFEGMDKINIKDNVVSTYDSDKFNIWKEIASLNPMLLKNFFARAAGLGRATDVGELKLQYVGPGKPQSIELPMGMEGRISSADIIYSDTVPFRAGAVPTAGGEQVAPLADTSHKLRQTKLAQEAQKLHTKLAEVGNDMLRAYNTLNNENPFKKLVNSQLEIRRQETAAEKGVPIYEFKFNEEEISHHINDIVMSQLHYYTHIDQKETYSPEEYKEQSEYAEHLQELNQTSPDPSGIRALVARIKQGEQDVSGEVAVDFAKIGLDPKAAGLHIDQTGIEQVIKSMIDQFGSSIEEVLKEQGVTLKEFTEKIKKLNLINKGRKGYSPETIITHERMHDYVSQLSPAELAKIVAAVETIQGPGTERSLLESIKRVWNNPKMNDNDAKVELAVTALVNETKYADKDQAEFNLPVNVSRELIQTIAKNMDISEQELIKKLFGSKVGWLKKGSALQNLESIQEIKAEKFKE